MSFLSNEEQNQLFLWIKQEVANKSDMTPETLANYIIKLVSRGASRDSLVTSLKDFFMPDALIEFVDELMYRMETKNFSLEPPAAKRAPTPPPAQEEEASDAAQEEVQTADKPEQQKQQSNDVETYQPPNTKVSANQNYESDTIDNKKPPNENVKRNIIYIAGIDKKVSINTIYTKFHFYDKILAIETLENVAYVEFETLLGAYKALKANAKRSLFDNQYYKLDFAITPDAEELAAIEAEHMKRRKRKEDMLEFKKLVDVNNAPNYYQKFYDELTEKKKQLETLDDDDERREEIQCEIDHLNEKVEYINTNFLEIKGE